MLLNQNTNQLCISSELSRYPKVRTRFLEALGKSNISVLEIDTGTNIWLRDFMPIQVSQDRYVQFVYDPIY